MKKPNRRIDDLKNLTGNIAGDSLNPLPDATMVGAGTVATGCDDLDAITDHTLIPVFAV